MRSFRFTMLQAHSSPGSFGCPPYRFRRGIKTFTGRNGQNKLILDTKAITKRCEKIVCTDTNKENTFFYPSQKIKINDSSRNNVFADIHRCRYFQMPSQESRSQKFFHRLSLTRPSASATLTGKLNSCPQLVEVASSL